MEFNRLISLVLGFIVLILVFVWIGSRFRSATRTTTDARVTITMTPTVTPTPAKGQTGWNPFGFLFAKVTPTPTKTIAERITPTPTHVVVAGMAQEETTSIVYKNNKTGETQTIAGVQRIPETGTETLVIPIALSALSFGAYLRKRV